MAVVEALIKSLRQRKMKLALAESMTCGLASYKMNSCSDTSSVFTGSIVSYNEEVKTGLLKIDKNTLETYTAESQEVTNAMVVQLSTLISADVHAAITGLSAPGGSESKEKPVGTIFISLLFKGEIFRLRSVLDGTATEITEKSCDLLFGFIKETIEKHS